MARDLGVAVGTVANWAARRREVPGPAAVALRLLASCQGQSVSGSFAPRGTAAARAAVAANGEASAAAAHSTADGPCEREVLQGPHLAQALADLRTLQQRWARHSQALKLLQQRVTALEAA